MADVKIAAVQPALALVVRLHKQCQDLGVHDRFESLGEPDRLHDRREQLVGPPADRRCPGHRPEAYQASVTKLKPKRYQVIVYTADAKDRWRPWKAGVADVP